jgi:hypothetical protein
MRKRVIHRYWIYLRYFVTISCGLTILLTVATGPGGNPFHEGPDSVGAQSCGIAIAVLVIYWCMAFAMWVEQTFFSPVIDQAMQRVPSPDEIELELRRQGQNPSIQDVAAIHQMATARRNEAVGALAIIGAIFYAGRRL